MIRLIFFVAFIKTISRYYLSFYYDKKSEKLFIAFQKLLFLNCSNLRIIQIDIIIFLNLNDSATFSSRPMRKIRWKLNPVWTRKKSEDLPDQCLFQAGSENLFRFKLKTLNLSFLKRPRLERKLFGNEYSMPGMHM
jgi:hypothetical protein